MRLNRNFLFLILLIVVGCAEHGPRSQQTAIDTAKLFNPTGQFEDFSAGETGIWKGYIALFGVNYSAVLNDRAYNLESLDQVKLFVASNKELISKKHLFYIIIDSITPFNKTLGIINILKENDVNSYKVINYVQYFKPPDPIAISTPTSITTEIINRDASQLTIEIFSNGFKTKLNKDSTKLQNVKELDGFIKTHKSLIRGIAIKIDKEAAFDQFNSVIEVLKKNEFTKYNLLSDPSGK